MTEYNVNLNKEDLIGLLTENDAMAELVSTVLNQVLEAQCREQLQAEPYERTSERAGYRNGTRARTLYTRVGPLQLRVPQTRNGFSTDLFRRYQRHEKALVLSLMEMYLQGVSTRKVTEITEKLCGASFSSATVSHLNAELDNTLAVWRQRDLSDKRYPFLIVDALVVDVRREGAIRHTGVLIVYGVTEQGQREPLDFSLADSECEASWAELFAHLKDRGLHGVDLVVSDAHKGLVKALKKQFQGAQWQRCQTHLARNILDKTPRRVRKAVADRLKLVFKAEDEQTARKLAQDLIDDYESCASKAMATLETGMEAALTVLRFPKRYRQKLRTTNLAERMNSELRRRERVIRIFPSEHAAERLIGALLNELYEEWLHSRHYMNMSEYWDWCQEQQEASENQTKVITMAQ